MKCPFSQAVNQLKKKERLPYSVFASFYDHMMDHVDYRVWAEYIDLLFDRLGNRISRVVDGGCGTGRLAVELEQLGYHVVGFDRSYPMVAEAAKNRQIPFWQGDLSRFGLVGEWDAFLCLYDTIHYLSLDHMGRLFWNVKDSLGKDGLFIIDIVPEKSVIKYWADFMEIDRINGVEVVRRSWYDRPKKKLYTELTFMSQRNKKRTFENHVQTIYDETFICSVAENAGLKCIGQFHDYTLKKGCKESDRIHLVFQQEAM